MLEYAHFEARKLNVVTEDLPRREYDFVHARFLLAYLPKRESVLAKLPQTLRPGGWILVEVLGFGMEEPDPSGEASMRRMFKVGMTTIHKHLDNRGVDRHFVSRQFGKLNSLGFTKVKAVGRSITMGAERANRKSCP